MECFAYQCTHACVFLCMQEHDCKLTRDIVELVDREADLLVRDVPEHALEGAHMTHLLA